ncbi:hypothetical protein ANO14919_101680 [Xylariales sp. No.14919]|nr:hypothetical protein ANO14919_101680 [Xylariales sp. No.14919]
MGSTQPGFWNTYDFPNRAAFTFSSTDSLMVFCPDWPEPHTFDNDPPDQKLWLNPEAECTILLREDDRNISITMATARGLCAQWGLPASCGEFLFTSHPGKGVYSEPLSSDGVLCVWYIIPVTQQNPDNGDLENFYLRVCHVINKQACRSRSIAICPQIFHPNISEAFRMQLSASGRSGSKFFWPGWFSTHLVVIQVAQKYRYQSFLKLFYLALTMVEAATKSTAGGSLSMETTNSCDKTLRMIDDWERSCSSTKCVVAQLYELSAGMSTGDLTGTEIVSAALQNVLNDIECNFDVANKFKFPLVMARAQLVESIKLRNATYMRQNTIHLRRMAEQSRIEAEQTKLHADSSARHATTAARIAFVTLLYLPPTFIATVFSTPFLQLDDKMQFNAIGGIWLYLITSLVITVLTLIFYYGTVYPWKRGGQTKATQTSTMEGQDTKPEDPDRVLLEPGPFKEPDLLATLTEVYSGIGKPGHHLPLLNETELSNLSTK